MGGPFPRLPQPRTAPDDHIANFTPFARCVLKWSCSQTHTHTTHTDKQTDWILVNGFGQQFDVVLQFWCKLAACFSYRVHTYIQTDRYIHSRNLKNVSFLTQGDLKPGNSSKSRGRFFLRSHYFIFNIRESKKGRLISDFETQLFSDLMLRQEGGKWNTSKFNKGSDLKRNNNKKKWKKNSLKRSLFLI